MSQYAVVVKTASQRISYTAIGASMNKVIRNAELVTVVIVFGLCAVSDWIADMVVRIV